MPFKIELTKAGTNVHYDDAVIEALSGVVAFNVGESTQHRNLWGIICATIRNANYDVIVSDHERELLKSLTRPGHSLVGAPRFGDGLPPVYTSVSATIGKKGYELASIGFINVEGRGVDNIIFTTPELVGTNPTLVASQVQNYLYEQEMEYPSKLNH